MSLTIDSLIAHFEDEGFHTMTGRQGGVESLRVYAPRSGNRKAVDFRMDITPEIRPGAEVGLAALRATLTATTEIDPTTSQGPYSIFRSLIIANIAIILEVGDMDRMEEIVDVAVEQSR
jgi:hypothetical protein